METFQECGWPAWVILLFTIVSVAVSLVSLGLAIVKPRVGVVFGVVAVGVALSPAAMGGIGTLRGRSVVDEVLKSGAIDPEQHARIRAEGYREAGQCTTLGLSFGALPLLLSAAGLGVALARRKRAPASAT